jgi:hypothetical protein
MRECEGDCTFSDIVVKSAVNAPRTNTEFERMTKHRGIEFAYIGMRVIVDDSAGIITGNIGMNLAVMYYGWDVPVNCHPHWRVTYFADDGSIVMQYGD